MLCGHKSSRLWGISGYDRISRMQIVHRLKKEDDLDFAWLEILEKNPCKLLRTPSNGGFEPSIMEEHQQRVKIAILRAIVAIRTTWAVSWWSANGFDVVQLLSLSGNTILNDGTNGNTDLDSNTRMRKLGFSRRTGRAHLLTAHGAGHAHLLSAQEEGPAHLLSAQEKEPAHLLSAQEEGPAHLLSAQEAWSAHLLSAQAAGSAHLLSAQAAELMK
ncbi:hypothetical protein L1987_69246 [Smallanthus sonchifolius]|uniref:Uncharacterized protein n=1 Tax=Smallanthus sonchifolius TaxID=185202 RepID=A0ACB9B6K4_9ASTR|nr:hypothetical protein L1987_69246 [Smallanthus sonchifolius]